MSPRSNAAVERTQSPFCSVVGRPDRDDAPTGGRCNEVPVVQFDLGRDREPGVEYPLGVERGATVPKASLRCHRLQAVGTDNKIKSARSRLLEVDQDAVASAVIVPSNR
jgi:hypothetical protein